MRPAQTRVDHDDRELWFFVWSSVMWIVCGSGSHAVAAPDAETRVHELVRGLLRCIWTDGNALTSGFPVFLSSLSAALSMFQLAEGSDLCNLQGLCLLLCVLRTSMLSSISIDSFFFLRGACLTSSESISSIPIGLTLTAAKNLRELVQNRACSCACSIYDNAALVLCMSHLDVRTCE